MQSEVGLGDLDLVRRRQRRCVRAASHGGAGHGDERQE
jgi:hypothetical protein